MKNKRGQVTFFIIITIVIVAAVAAVIYIQQTQQCPSGEIQVIKSYLDSCFNEKGKQTILEISKQGFYYELSVAHIDFLGEKTAYYFKNEQNIVPTTTTIEDNGVKSLHATCIHHLCLNFLVFLTHRLIFSHLFP